jgi:hypothetical protein
MPVVAALMLGATLDQTCGEPSLFSPSSNIPSTSQGFAPLKPTPIYLDKLPTPPPPLKPGVYQTYPYTIIIITPGRGIDDQSIVEIPNANSKMPVIKPHLKVVPLSPAKQLRRF